MELKDALKKIYSERVNDEEIVNPFMLYSKLSDYCIDNYEVIQEVKDYYQIIKSVNIFRLIINNNDSLENLLSTLKKKHDTLIPSIDNKKYIKLCWYTLDAYDESLHIKYNQKKKTNNQNTRPHNNNNVNYNKEGNVVQPSSNQPVKKRMHISSSLILLIFFLLLSFILILSVAKDWFNINKTVKTANIVFLFISTAIIIISNLFFYLFSNKRLKKKKILSSIFNCILLIVIYIFNYYFYTQLSSNLVMNIITTVSLLYASLFLFSLYSINNSYKRNCVIYFISGATFIITIILQYISNTIFTYLNINLPLRITFYVTYASSLIGWGIIFFNIRQSSKIIILILCAISQIAIILSILFTGLAIYKVVNFLWFFIPFLTFIGTKFIIKKVV